MQITATFDNSQEMMDFCRMMAGKEVPTDREIPTTGSTEAGYGEKSEVVTAPTAVPVSAPVQSVPITQPVSAAVPTAAVASAVTTAGTSEAGMVPTATQAYELDDLARAAMTLMDVGRQGDLQQLLTQFGVAALPLLPKDQYGAFATALRGMGAQI